MPNPKLSKNNNNIIPKLKSPQNNNYNNDNNDNYNLNNIYNNQTNLRDLQLFGQEAIMKFFEILNLVKLFHWRTHSHSVHKATDHLYEELNENFDEFVEILLGKCTKRINLTKIKTLPLHDYLTLNQLSKKIKTFQKYLVNMNKNLDKLLDSDLLNVRDEILGNLNQFLFLLTLK